MWRGENCLYGISLYSVEILWMSIWPSLKPGYTQTGLWVDFHAKSTHCIVFQLSLLHCTLEKMCAESWANCYNRICNIWCGLHFKAVSQVKYTGEWVWNQMMRNTHDSTSKFYGKLNWWILNYKNNIPNCFLII